MKSYPFHVLGVIAWCLLFGVNWEGMVPPGEMAERPADSKRGTDVTAVLAAPLTEDRNLLWCATFQIAWDQAADHYGRPLRVQPPTPLAEALNKARFAMDWIDPKAVVTIHGAMDKGVLSRIDREMKALTGRKSNLTRELAGAATEDADVFFAAISRDLKFGESFGKLPSTKLAGRSVRWFGFRPDAVDTAAMRQQTRIHHYGAAGDFVIELVTTDPDEQLLLARLPQRPATAAALGKIVMDRCMPDAPTAQPADLLAVPAVKLDVTTEFADLRGRHVTKGRFIQTALQSIDFSLDETGVKLRSEAAMAVGCSAKPAIEPRLIIVRPPFAVLMKRRNAPQPYFLAWFANAQFLQP